MTSFVLDASVALAWVLDNPVPVYALEVRQELFRGKRGLVPALWHLEIANGLAMAERRRDLEAPARHGKQIEGALGEGEHRSFYEIIEASAPFGWMTFDQSILNAYENNLISEETAKLYASRKGRVSRGIDIIQKTRGMETDLDSGLRLDLPENAFR